MAFLRYLATMSSLVMLLYPIEGNGRLQTDRTPEQSDFARIPSRFEKVRMHPTIMVGPTRL